jgi:hypothetical protein
MVYRSTLIRTPRRVGICLVVLFVVLNVFLRVKTYRFQRRAEPLMADIQALKLRQSNWLEADHLISRWGKYGNYKGHCDASFCRYSIVLNSPGITLERWAFAKAPANWNNHFAVLTASLFFMLCEHLGGGRSVTVRTTFVVQDSVVLRKSAVFIYSVPVPLDTHSSPRATLKPPYNRRMAAPRERAVSEHPFYAVTRPGGCSFCSMANVTFTPDTPDPEMRRLTTFDLNCITRLRACRYLEDIYPAAENWHLLDRPHHPNRSTPRMPRSPLHAVYRSLPEVAKPVRS